MNDQAKQDVNNEVVEEAVLEAVVEKKTDEKVSENQPVAPSTVSSKKTIKDYLSKDLFSGIKVISGKEDQAEIEKLADYVGLKVKTMSI